MLTNESAAVEEIAKQIDHQVLDKMPELQGCHESEVLSHLSKEKKALDCDKNYVPAEKHEELKVLEMQTEEKDLTCINTPLLMKFENCIAKSEYIGLELSKKLLPPKFAFYSLCDGSSACVGNFAFGVSRISRVARDDCAEMLNFDSGGQQLRKLNEPCLEVCSFMGLSMLKIDDIVTQYEEIMLFKSKGEANVPKETSNLAAYQVLDKMSEPQNCLEPELCVELVKDTNTISRYKFDPNAPSLIMLRRQVDLKTIEASEMTNSLRSPSFGSVIAGCLNLIIWEILLSILEEGCTQQVKLLCPLIHLRYGVHLSS